MHRAWKTRCAIISFMSIERTLQGPSTEGGAEAELRLEQLTPQFLNAFRGVALKGFVMMEKEAEGADVLKLPEREEYWRLVTEIEGLRMQDKRFFNMEAYLNAGRAHLHAGRVGRLVGTQEQENNAERLRTLREQLPPRIAGALEDEIWGGSIKPEAFDDYLQKIEKFETLTPKERQELQKIESDNPLFVLARLYLRSVRDYREAFAEEKRESDAYFTSEMVNKKESGEDVRNIPSVQKAREAWYEAVKKRESITPRLLFAQPYLPEHVLQRGETI